MAKFKLYMAVAYNDGTWQTVAKLFEDDYLPNAISLYSSEIRKDQNVIHVWYDDHEYISS